MEIMNPSDWLNLEQAEERIANCRDDSVRIVLRVALNTALVRVDNLAKIEPGAPFDLDYFIACLEKLLLKRDLLGKMLANRLSDDDVW